MGMIGEELRRRHVHREMNRNNARKPSVEAVRARHRIERIKLEANPNLTDVQKQRRLASLENRRVRDLGNVSRELARWQKRGWDRTRRQRIVDFIAHPLSSRNRQRRVERLAGRRTEERSLRDSERTIRQRTADRLHRPWSVRNRLNRVERLAGRRAVERRMRESGRTRTQRLADRVYHPLSTDARAERVFTLEGKRFAEKLTSSDRTTRKEMIDGLPKAIDKPPVRQQMTKIDKANSRKERKSLTAGLVESLAQSPDALVGEETPK